jgi:hypothetical protein
VYYVYVLRTPPRAAAAACLRLCPSIGDRLLMNDYCNVNNIMSDYKSNNNPIGCESSVKRIQRRRTDVINQ